MDQEELIRLVIRISKDDRRAFNTFFHALYPRFYQLAFSITKSDATAEEVLAEVFVKIWNNRRKLPEIERLHAYLFTSVRNQCRTYFSSKVDHDSLNETHASKYMHQSHPESLLLDKELVEMLDRAIAQLPERCKMVFNLVKIDQLSYQEVADVLGISHKTVQGQMVIALKKIKTSLSNYFSEKT